MKVVRADQIGEKKNSSKTVLGRPTFKTSRHESQRKSTGQRKKRCISYKGIGLSMGPSMTVEGLEDGRNTIVILQKVTHICYVYAQYISFFIFRNR